MSELSSVTQAVKLRTIRLASVNNNYSRCDASADMTLVVSLLLGLFGQFFLGIDGHFLSAF